MMKTLNENKEKLGKEKVTIINNAKNIKNLIKENNANSDVYERQEDLLKKSINKYLDIYEDSI